MATQPNRLFQALGSLICRKKLIINKLPVAGIILLRKTPLAIGFVENWLAACEDERIITETPSVPLSIVSSSTLRDPPRCLATWTTPISDITTMTSPPSLCSSSALDAWLLETEEKRLVLTYWNSQPLQASKQSWRWTIFDILGLFIYHTNIHK